MAVRASNFGAAGAMVRVPKTAELVAGQIRNRIVRGELHEGDALPPESELMEQFGVSRPTLREAFRILESESLISVRRGARGGARVHTPDLAVAARYAGLLLQVQKATLADVYEARSLIEPAAARLLAQRHTKADVRALRETIEDVRSSLERPAELAGAELGTATTRFHECLVERCGNQTLSMLGGMLFEIVEAHTSQAIMRDMSSPDTSRNFQRALRAYDKLTDLIEAGDADAAERFWREHMEVAGSFLLRWYGPKTVVDLIG